MCSLLTECIKCDIEVGPTIRASFRGPVSKSEPFEAVLCGASSGKIWPEIFCDGSVLKIGRAVASIEVEAVAVERFARGPGSSFA